MINVKNKSHAVTAQIVVPEAGAHGVIIAQGGLFGGWSLYTDDGCLAYCYNLLGLQYFKVRGTQPIPPGDHQVRMEFGYDGGGLGKGGTVSLYLDGDKVGEGRVDQTQPVVFSLDDKTDVGIDICTPVSDDYDSADSKFNGQIDWVRIDVSETADDTDHVVTQEQFRAAMAEQ